MNEIIIMMAGAFSKEEIIEMISNSIKEWEINPNEKTEASIAINSQLLLSKFAIGNGKPLDLIKEIDKMKIISERMSSNTKN